MNNPEIEITDKSNKSIIIIHPDNLIGGNSNQVYKDEMTNCLNQIDSIASDSEGNFRILKMTVFVDTENIKDFDKLKSELDSLIKSKTGFSDFPVLIVAQAPANNKNLAVEILGLQLKKENYQYEFYNNQLSEIGLLKIDDDLEIYASVGNKLSSVNESVYEIAQKCFNEVKNILKDNNLDFGNIVRQWGYIGRITNYGFRNTNEGEKELENYQMFNIARAECYKISEWKNGYPSATGIGARVKGSTVEFIATNNRTGKKIIPLHNPRQSDAHEYTGKQFVSKTELENLNNSDTPKFERGKVVISGDSLDLYISGTAAIIGEDSVSGDIKEQTQTTIDNILKLCSKENLTAHGIHLKNDLPKFSGVRAYIKNQSDSKIVKKLCEETFGKIPILYVIADVCREELLVEIEAYLNCFINIHN